LLLVVLAVVVPAGIKAVAVVRVVCVLLPVVLFP
jgi:hypothetical protein